MFTINNTIERLKLNVSGMFGLFDKIGVNFPIEWQNEDRIREMKYNKLYYFLPSPPSNNDNSNLQPFSSTPVRNMSTQSSYENVSISTGFSSTSSTQLFQSDKQKKSRGLNFFQKKSSSNYLSTLMLDPDENFKKLMMSTPGLPHFLRRQFWFSVSGGFKLSLQFSDAWDQACHSAALAEGETNLPLTDSEEFDAFLGGRIDTLTFLPPAIQLQVSTFLHVFTHAQCGTVEFAPMICTSAALLMLYLEPSLAYLSLTSMVNRSKMENGFYFNLSREALLAESSVFRILCEKLCKNVVRHAESININMEAVHLVCAPMLFFPFIPLQSALTLFDIFLLEGRKFILQFSLAILQSEERNLLQTMDAASFVEVIVNALERLADVDVLKAFIIKNVEKIDIGKWRRIIALEESYLDPKNKKMMPFVMREDDQALVSFEQRIEADHMIENPHENEQEINSNNNNNYDEDEEEIGDIEINLDIDQPTINDSSNRKLRKTLNVDEIMSNNGNNNMNSCGSYNKKNFELFQKKAGSSVIIRETDSLLSEDQINASTTSSLRVKNKRLGNIRSSSSTVSPKSLEPSLKRNLIPASNDGIDEAQRMMAPSINQSMPKIHGGRLLDVNLFYAIRSRLHPVYHRFSCQLVFAKSLNGGSLENLINTTMLSYSPSTPSNSSIFSSNSSIMFSSGSFTLTPKSSMNIFVDSLNDSEDIKSSNNNSSSGSYYQCNLPHILVIETASGKRFGALLSDSLKPDSHNEFYGRPMTFVFDAILSQIYQRYPCPNSMFISSSPEMLSIGGEFPAIKLPADLSFVESYSCETFGSPSLISGVNDGSADAVVEVEVYRLKNIAKRNSASKKYSAKTV